MDTILEIKEQLHDGYYADGLLITYGNPRQHIWTYIAGEYDNRTAYIYNCPCAAGGGSPPPPFVATNYYCESGAADIADHTAYYLNDVLWDRSGCITSNCCDLPMQPWFYRELNATTSSDIEARLCNEQGFYLKAILIDQLGRSYTYSVNLCEWFVDLDSVVYNSRLTDITI